MAERSNHRWTMNEKRIIMANPMKSDRQLSYMLGLSAAKIKAFRRRAKLPKSEQFITYCKTNNVAMGGGRPIRKLLQE